MHLAVCFLLFALGPLALAQDLATEAETLIRNGEAQSARRLLEEAAKRSPENPGALLAFAQFLDRHNDPGARVAYDAAIRTLAPGSADRKPILRRLVILDLLAGDRGSAEKRLSEYRAAGGTDWAALPEAAAPGHQPGETIQIPGPLSSFARMAALSPDIDPRDILPALARNIVTSGYQASLNSESLEQTEYLKLIIRYLSQARELTHLAGPEQTLNVPECESTQTGELLRVLGYRMRGGCGGDLVLETVNATRAFLTIDSGFPLAELEHALRTNRPFTYDYKPTEAYAMFGADYWLSVQRKTQEEFIDAFLSDPGLCRLYLGLSKLDRATGEIFRKNIEARRLKTFAHVLDFYGGMFELRDGTAVVPGGTRAASAWADLAGASPDKGVEFFDALIAKDDGWLASYFDSLSRVSLPMQAYLTQPDRLKRFYQAIRGRVTSPGPARPVFRANADMMLLTTRLRLDADGRPYLPGGIQVWKDLFATFPKKRIDKKLQESAPSWKEADDVVEALYALCRKSVENEPLKIFFALTEMDRMRKSPLDPSTVALLTRQYHDYGDQYPLLAASPALSAQSIGFYLDTVAALDQIRNTDLRTDAIGMFQASVGLWSMLVNDGAIPEGEADLAFHNVVLAYAKAKSPTELFDAGRTTVQALLRGAGQENSPGSDQEKMLNLLAGSPRGGSATQAKMLQEMRTIFEAQRLIPVDQLMDLAANLEGIPSGSKLDTALVNRISTRIADIQMPRSSLTSAEKNSLSFGYWAERHIANERKLRLRPEIDKASGDPEKLRAVLGLLTPHMRDTLVGFNYLRYAPPGAQILHTNPVFVRSHDFMGTHGARQTWRTTEVFGSGWPANSGGRLVGSLSGLPYALAQSEQNFLVPNREQALIWADLVPQMIVSAKVPRWWNVKPSQTHYVGLHVRHGESLLAEAAVDAARRTEVLEILRSQAAPARVYSARMLLERGDVRGALEHITPSELYFLAKEAVERNPQDQGGLAVEIRRLREAAGEEVSHAAISRAFGTPKPTLTRSYNSELLFLRTYPTLMGFSSRILAESWESSNLFFAALADEAHVQPEELNLLIPEWTRKTVENIFATHLEDWPALLRSLRKVGQDVRAAYQPGPASGEQASLRESGRSN